MKLKEAWYTMVLPEMDTVAMSTMQSYEETIGLWTDFSPNPDIGQINYQIVKEFRSVLMTTPFRRGRKRTKEKRSPATVNRIMRNLHAAIEPLLPADRLNPGGRGLIGFFKWPKSLAVQKELPFVFSNADLDRLYLGCDACRPTSPYARRKGPMNEPRLWRLALVLAHNSAARTWDLLGDPDPDPAIHRDGFRRSRVKLDGDGGEFKFGSISYTAQKTGKLHRFPLNECAARHVEDYLRRPHTTTDDRIFAGFAKGRAFYQAWSRICKEAGVAGVFESLRKTSVTRHNNVVWQAGLWLSGHVSPGVFGCYDNPNERIFDAVYGLPLPVEFVNGMKLLSGAV